MDGGTNVDMMRSLLAEQQAEIERLTRERERTCEWTYDEDGPYETGCGRAWEFVDGDVLDNWVKYCPFCGGRVTEPKAAGGDDAS